MLPTLEMGKQRHRAVRSPLSHLSVGQHPDVVFPLSSAPLDLPAMGRLDRGAGLCAGAPAHWRNAWPWCSSTGDHQRVHWCQCQAHQGGRQVIVGGWGSRGHRWGSRIWSRFCHKLALGTVEETGLWACVLSLLRGDGFDSSLKHVADVGLGPSRLLVGERVSTLTPALLLPTANISEFHTAHLASGDTHTYIRPHV